MHNSKAAIAAGALILMNIMPAATDPAKSPTIVNPADLYDPAPYGYSHAVVATNVTGIVQIAGQGGENAAGRLVPEFEAQVAQAYVNLSTALAAACIRPDQVIKINTYVVDYEQSMLAVMTKYVTKTFGGHRPAQTLIPVPRLALDGMLFEVDATGVLQD